MKSVSMTPRPDDAIAELARGRHSVWSREEATAIGLSTRAQHRRVQSCRWREVLPGIYSYPGPELTWEAKLTAALLWLPGSVACRRAAGALHGLVEKTLPIEILSQKRTRSPTPWLRVHHTEKLPRSEWLDRNGFRFTCVERTILDLAAVLSPTRLELVVDQAMDLGKTSLERLEQRAGPAVNGTRSIRALRDILAERQPTTGKLASPFEQEVRDLLATSLVLPVPIRQYWVELPSTRYRIDFVYEEAMVGVEAQPYATHRGKMKSDYDNQRHNELTAAGLAMFYLTPTRLEEDPVAALAEVESAYLARLNGSTSREGPESGRSREVG